MPPELGAIKPVRFRHALQHREPAAGFAARLASLNGRSMSTFLRDMVIAPRSIDKGVPAAVHKLALKGGADPEALMRYTPSAIEGRDRFHQVGNEVLGHLDVNRTYFRFCPHCVLEDLEIFGGPVAARPWLRLEWTISHIRSCGKHEAFLTTTQPVRRRFQPFDFVETMTLYLDRLQQAAAGTLPAPLSPFQDWLFARLDGDLDPSNWLNRLPLYAAADWCEALGISRLHPPKVRTSTLTEAQWAEAADAGYEIARRGEAGINEFLAELNQAQESTRGFWGPRDTYGYAYGFLQRTIDDEALDPVRELVRSFAIATIPIEPGTDVLGQTLEKATVHTVRTAARVSGAHDRTIRRLFERKGLGERALAAGRRNHRVVVEAAALDDVLTKLKTAATVPTLVKEWGIPLMHIRALIAGGHLATVTGSETHAGAKHRIARDDFDQMVSRFFSGAVEIATPDPNQQPIVRARHRAATSTDQVLDWIFNGSLKWKGRLQGRSDYGALLLDVEELRELVRSEPVIAGFTKQTILDFIPGLGAKAPQHLIATGHLRTAQEFSPLARRFVDVITVESAVAFRNQFVTLGELTRTTGLHHKQVRSALRRVGVLEALDAKVFQTFFFNRQDVDLAVKGIPRLWDLGGH